MPFEGDEKKAYNKKRYLERKQEALEGKGRPFESDSFRQDVDWAKKWDEEAQGKRFLSEVSSMSDLALLFHGAKKQIEDDEEEGPKKKSKIVVLKPSTAEIFGRKLTFWQWLILRDVCRKDGFFLGKQVLGRRLLLERVHLPVFDMFVQKDFDGAYHEGYTITDVHEAIRKNTKNRHELMLLDPRGNLKTTINCIDATQWLLNVPDIRILIVSGGESLSSLFLKEVKGYFTLKLGGKPSDFHHLFPEYVLRGRAAATGTALDCPVRIHMQKESSLWVESIVAGLSGKHCDILKGDDVIDNRNSNTEEFRENIKRNFDGADDLVDKHGRTENLGTRYYPNDWYGERIKSEAPLEYFCRPCWTVKPEFKDVRLLDLEMHMVDMLFPEIMTGGELTPDSNRLLWADLRKRLKKNERQFRNQYLNEPVAQVGDESITFDPDVLTKHSYDKSNAGLQSGDIYVSWDTAYTDSKRSDLSVGVAGKIYENQFGQWGIIVLEVIFDHWKPSDIALNMIAFNKRWQPKLTLIEKTNTYQFMQNELYRIGQKYGAPLEHVWWFEMDHSRGAKRNRIKNLEILLNNDLLWFVKGTWLDIAFKQFSEYKGESSTTKRKDDIPDAISFLVKCSPRLRMKRP